MKNNEIEVFSVSTEHAAHLTSENKHGYVWDSGLYVVIDDCRATLESRAEVEQLIHQLQEAANRLWQS